MTTQSLLPVAKQHFHKNGGTLNAGGKVFTYAAGTNTKKTTYTDSSGTVTNTNPIILDSRGEAVIYGTGSYKLVHTLSTDTDPPVSPIWTQDNVTVPLDAAAAAASIITAMSNTYLAAMLPARWQQRRVMAVAPTVTYSAAGVHTMPATRVYLQAADGASGVVLTSTFNYRRISKMYALNAVTYDTGSSYGATPGTSLGSNMSAFAFTYDAATLELAFQNNLQAIWFKVDGEYVSLTPTTLIGDQVNSIIYFNFGSAKMREIEVLVPGVGVQLRFAGVFIEPTASIAPSAPRGPKVFIIGDSFGEGTGATTPINNYPMVLGDALGWDNVYTSSVGGTGILANSSGTRLTYRARLAFDVIPYAPDIIVIQGSPNDTGQNPTALGVELTALIAAIRAALPLCKIIVTSMMSNKGGGFQSTAFYLAADAVKSATLAAGVSFIDMLEQALPAGQAAVTGTITRVAAAAATRIYTNIQMPSNVTLKFADGQRFRTVLGTPSGSGDFICDGDSTVNGLAIGATFTVVGNSAWQGNGRVGATTGNGNCDLIVGSDGIHPTDAGHIMIGTGLAVGFKQALAT